MGFLLGTDFIFFFIKVDNDFSLHFLLEKNIIDFKPISIFIYAEYGSEGGL